MRLFVAIDLEDDARRASAAEQKRLMQELHGESSLRMVRPEQMHLTLAFLGEVDDVRGAAIVDAMREDVKAAPFPIVYAGLGVFPPHGAPRVLWLGGTTGRDAPIAVQRPSAHRRAPGGVGPAHPGQSPQPAL